MLSGLSDGSPAFPRAASMIRRVTVRDAPAYLIATPPAEGRGSFPAPGSRTPGDGCSGWPASQRCPEGPGQSRRASPVSFSNRACSLGFGGAVPALIGMLSELSARSPLGSWGYLCARLLPECVLSQGQHLHLLEGRPGQLPGCHPHPLCLRRESCRYPSG